MLVVCIAATTGGDFVAPAYNPPLTNTPVLSSFTDSNNYFKQELEPTLYVYSTEAPTLSPTPTATFTPTPTNTPTQEPTATNTPIPTATPEPIQQTVYTYITGDELFASGYLEHGGNPNWLAHFLYDVAPCEGGYEYLASYASAPFYLSRLQFNPGSWATAAAATGRYDPANPYDVGANTAWWSNAIDHPGTTSGWPYCWWIGNVP